MYTTVIFETAMNACGYKTEKIKYTKNSGEVCRVIGRVSIPKKVTIDGIRKTVFRNKRFRWDATGHCFSLKSNVRQRRFDLPIRSIVELKIQQNAESNL